MSTAGTGAVQQLGQRFGLSADQTSAALNQLVPALANRLQRNTSQEGGMDALLGALLNGNHAQYLDNPETLGDESTTQEGNAILGHILGSKDVSRAVADQASEQTGIGADTLKSMLPVVAAMVMGSLSKGGSASEAGVVGNLLGSIFGQAEGTPASGIGDVLGRLLGGS